MTGRELIHYILEKNLEDEAVFTDSSFLDFVTMEQAACRLGVGLATVKTLVALKKIPYVQIGETCYISPAHI